VGLWKKCKGEFSGDIEQSWSAVWVELSQKPSAWGNTKNRLGLTEGLHE